LNLHLSSCLFKMICSGCDVYSNRQLRALLSTSANVRRTDGEAHAPLLSVCTGWRPVAPQAALASVINHRHYHPSFKTRRCTAGLSSCDLRNSFKARLSVWLVCIICLRMFHPLGSQTHHSAHLSEATGTWFSRKLWCQKGKMDKHIKPVIEQSGLAGVEKMHSLWFSLFICLACCTLFLLSLAVVSPFLRDLTKTQPRRRLNIFVSKSVATQLVSYTDGL